MKYSEYTRKVLESTKESVYGLELDLRFDVMDFVKAKLQETGMSKKELALKLQMKPSQLSRILNAESNITLETVSRLYAAFGCRPALMERGTVIESQRVLYTTMNFNMSSIAKKGRDKYINYNPHATDQVMATGNILTH